MKFAVFDIDGTLIRWQLYHAIANALAKKGHFKPARDKAIREARMIWKRREYPESFKEYEQQLVIANDEMLTNLTVEQFMAATQEVFDEYKDQVYIYTRDLIKKLKAEGYLLFAISGSQTEIVEKIAGYYGFDDYAGTVHKHRDGRFTGEKEVVANDKLKILKSLVAEHQGDWKESIAVGDTASDIAMLEAVENPIAFNPERQLFVEAMARGWQIVVERKNVVYVLNPAEGRYVLIQ